MQQQQMAMVQTSEQYIFLHRVMRELFKERRLMVIDAHPYQNIVTDGAPLILWEESDYEELYMKPEKQDKQPPHQAPSQPATPSIHQSPGQLPSQEQKPCVALAS
ncbi:uncharacterized protein LOC135106241 isoform X2 [Scylla paramamosain]|uniref:uncharacterized protein LOC135106241 isoform X2 n=1 Tax=Scylla paramamosain TaxID=85552 RepID=UPI00308383A9